MQCLNFTEILPISQRAEASMKMKPFRVIFACILSISFAFSASAQTKAPSVAPSREKAIAASVDRFFAQLQNQEPRSYRQMIQSLRPFVDQAYIEHLERELRPRLDQRFPRFSLVEKETHYVFEIGVGREKQRMELLKKDPRIFARFRGVEILHSELGDPWKIQEKLELGAAKGTAKQSLIKTLFLEEAQAFNWALFGGLAIVGVGVAAGLFFLSRSKIKSEHQVKVDVPENYNVQVDGNHQLDTNHTLNVPVIDKVLDRGQK